MHRREFIVGLGAATTWPIITRAQQSVTPEISTHTDILQPSIHFGTGMNGKITLQAAYNNAMWCDAVCRAHDLPGEFKNTLWLTRSGTPRFYPDAVTTSGVDAAPTQLNAIADLVGSNRKREWFVKDSFHCLRLNSLGFAPLFDAEWIARIGEQHGIEHNQLEFRSTIVTDEVGLSAWERSWAGDAAESVASPQPRIFMPRLIADECIVFVFLEGDNGASGGGILNLGGNTVGLSNLFGPKMDWVYRCLTAKAHEIFPGLPLVGYEHGGDLAAAKLAGFETIGPLRIWRLPAATLE